MRPCQNCGKHHNLGQPASSQLALWVKHQHHRWKSWATPVVLELASSLHRQIAGIFWTTIDVLRRRCSWWMLVNWFLQADQSLHSTRSSTPLQRADSRRDDVKTFLLKTFDFGHLTTGLFCCSNQKSKVFFHDWRKPLCIFSLQNQRNPWSFFGGTDSKVCSRSSVLKASATLSLKKWQEASKMPLKGVVFSILIWS